MTKRETPYVCSNCGRERREVNYWFCLTAIPVPISEVGGSPVIGVGIFPWDKALAAARKTEHACGQDCAMQMASRFLATREFQRQPAGAARAKESQHKEPGAAVSEGSVGSGNPAIP